VTIPNTAPLLTRTAWFSSDRTIREYGDDIWRAPVLED
jgi:glucan phosphorylase